MNLRTDAAIMDRMSYQEMQEVEFKKMVREITNMAFDKYNYKEAGRHRL